MRMIRLILKGVTFAYINLHKQKINEIDPIQIWDDDSESLNPEIINIFINIGKIFCVFAFKLMKSSLHESSKRLSKMISCVYFCPNTEILKNQQGNIEVS